MFFLLIILLFCFSDKSYCIDFTIKTSYQSKNIDGVNILVYKADSIIYKDKFFLNSLTDNNGIAKFDIPEGKYFFIAEKKIKDGFLFGYYGLNPVHIRERQNINIILTKYPEDFLKNIPEKSIQGIVYFDNKPIEGVSVYLYLDGASEFKGPPYFYAITDENGFFKIPINEGSYYLIFRKKNKSSFGPPSSGDLIGFFPQFPLTIDKKGVNIYVSLFKIPAKRELSKNLNIYEIKGKVFDKNNMPLEGLYVGLYDNRELLGKPLYVSNPTDKNGIFTIFVKEKGSYYMGVRSSLGDTPSDNERVFYFKEIDIKDEERDYYFEIILD